MTTDYEESGKYLLDVINDSRFFTFLLVGLYIIITIVSTTDEMLVLHSQQVKLPLLEVQIPISGFFGFYSIAPGLIILLHINLLLELSLSGMGKKLHAYKEAAKLGSFQYIEFIIFYSLLIVTLIILPLLLLLLIQARFLAYHDWRTTFMHSVAIITDGVLLGLLWPGIGWYSDRAEEAPLAGKWKRLRDQRTLAMILCGLLLALPMAFISYSDDFSGSINSDNPASSATPDDSDDSDDSDDQRYPQYLSNWLLPWRNLNLHDKVLVPLEPTLIDSLRARQIDGYGLQKIPTSDFQGRNMTHADLTLAVLPRIDFRARKYGKYPTLLQGANLSWAIMPGVMLDQAQLQGAYLDGAWLLKAELRGTQLQGAHLQKASLQDATLVNANLQNAKLQQADLQNTNLQNAKLQQANLQNAKLRQADLQNANLQGATLSGAELQGAILSGAQLQGAILHGAQLQDTDLTHTNLQGTDLTEANLDGARLNQTQLEEAILNKISSIELRQLEQFHWNLAAHEKTPITLMGLACSNEYIAQGLAQQILISPLDSGRALWVTDLKKKLASQPPKPEDCLKADPSCPGICKLPQKTRDSLNNLVASCDR